MKLALVGYGKMGRAVDELAPANGFDVLERFGREGPLRCDELTRRRLAGATLIDFSTADAVLDTVKTAVQLSLNVVIGTTGWLERIDDVRRLVETSGIGVVYAPNFSVGVNVFYRLVDEAARLLSAIDGYDPFILDWHHRFKKDSPSGTALEIQNRMARHYGERLVPITSQRAGYVPSLHAVGFDSEADTIHMEHRTRSRRGLAEGALLAATWIASHPGFHDFREVLDSVLESGGWLGARQDRENLARSTTRR
jgi:4-hydroxy-tetrahydrodipicolinate reductase